MRKLVAEFGKNSRDEDWVYLEFEETTGQLFYVHEWSHTPHEGMTTNTGEIRKPLHEAAGEKHYSHASNAVQTLFERS